MVSVADVRLYECLADTLEQRYGQTEIAEILSSVRSKYYDDFLVKFNGDSVEQSISQCRACDNITNVPVAGWWNYQNPDLLIVASNSYADRYWIQSIASHLKAVGFSSAFCGVIHTTKCEVPKIEEQNRTNCIPFAYQQIDSSRPRALAVVGAQAFDLFRTHQSNYKESIGTSWWWGLYKVYCLPPVKEFHQQTSEVTLSMLQQCYEHIYGISSSDLITIKDE